MARLAIIDDEEGIRDVLTGLLEQAGHDIVAFADGAEALEALNLEEADLVITDLVMTTPGEKVIESLRSSGSDVPIVVVSGYLEDRDLQHLMDLGATRCYQKPIQPASFLAVIDLLLPSAGEAENPPA